MRVQIHTQKEREEFLLHALQFPRETLFTNIQCQLCIKQLKVKIILWLKQFISVSLKMKGM